MKSELSKAKRLRIYQRDEYQCWYCGKQLINDTPMSSASSLTVPDIMLLPTLDHLHPRIKGGYDTDENLVTACRRCNSEKGRKTVDEYRSYLSNQLDHCNDVAAWVRGESVVITFWGEGRERLIKQKTQKQSENADIADAA